MMEGFFYWFNGNGDGNGCVGVRVHGNEGSLYVAGGLGHPSLLLDREGRKKGTEGVGLGQ